MQDCRERLQNVKTQRARVPGQMSMNGYKSKVHCKGTQGTDKGGEDGRQGELLCREVSAQVWRVVTRASSVNQLPHQFPKDQRKDVG